jgi:hypothetical protein
LTREIPSCSRDLKVYEKRIYHSTQVSKCTLRNELPARLVCFIVQKVVSAKRSTDQKPNPEVFVFYFRRRERHPIIEQIHDKLLNPARY